MFNNVYAYYRKAVEAKAKILAFQLLKSILDNCGTVFKTSPIFITAIKQYLCSAMVHASISPVLDLFQLNLHLLTSLIHKFRNALKPEIEVIHAEYLDIMYFIFHYAF
jgi:Sec7-like guanine-nucleotide exchange factor